MHPADVADFVADQVTSLREALQGRPDLGVVDVSTHCGVQINVTFEKQDRHLVQQGLDVGIAVAQPGGNVAAGVALSGTIQRLWRVPDLGVPATTRTLVLHLDATNFDSQPPTANLLRTDGSQLPANEWPNQGNGDGIISGHGDYDRPIFCRRGLREYHQHVQHQDDPWDLHREATTLQGIVIPLLHDLKYRWLGNQ